MKALVVGGDGLVGKALSLALRKRGDAVVRTTRRPKARSDDIFLDLADPPNVQLPVVDVAVFCAAIAEFNECRRDPNLAERVNVTSPASIAAHLVSRGTRVVLLSTSAVFDCAEPRMQANRARSPRGVYGRLKAKAEIAFLTLGEMAAVFRLTKIVTPEWDRMLRWINTLAERRPVQAFADMTISPLTIEHVTEALIAVIDDGQGGIYQVSGADDISYADVARHLADRLAVATTLVEAQTSSVVVPADELTSFTSLDTSRLTAISAFRPPLARDVIEDVFGSALLASRRSAA